MFSSTTQHAGADTHSEGPDNAAQDTEQLAEKKALIESLFEGKGNHRRLSDGTQLRLNLQASITNVTTGQLWLYIDSEGYVRGPEACLWMKDQLIAAGWSFETCGHGHDMYTAHIWFGLTILNFGTATFPTEEEAVLRCYLEWKRTTSNREISESTKRGLEDKKEKK